MSNPFELLEQRLTNIETLLQELKNKPKELENKIYSVKELSKFAGCSELTIRNWIKEGKVKANKINRRIFINSSQFETGLEEMKSLKYKR